MTDADLARRAIDYLATASVANGQAAQAHFIRSGRLSMVASVQVTVALAAVGAALLATSERMAELEAALEARDRYLDDIHDEMDSEEIETVRRQIGPLVVILTEDCVAVTQGEKVVLSYDLSSNDLQVATSYQESANG